MFSSMHSKIVSSFNYRCITLAILAHKEMEKFLFEYLNFACSGSCAIYQKCACQFKPVLCQRHLNFRVSKKYIVFKLSLC